MGSFVRLACTRVALEPSLDPLVFQVPVASGELRDMIAGMVQDDSWEDANLRDVYSYLRNSRLLRIPEEYRSIIPESL